jgi:hypothetical protein
MHGSCVLKGATLDIHNLFTQATEQLWAQYFTGVMVMYQANYVHKIRLIQPLLDMSPPGHTQKGNKIHLKSQSHLIGSKIGMCTLDTRATITFKNGSNWMQGSG